MKDETILKLCLTGSVFGLIVVYFLFQPMSYPQIALKDVDSSLVGKTISVMWRVESIRSSEKALFIVLIDNSWKIDLVLFKSDLNISGIENKSINVLGTVQEYNGKLEIIGKTISLVEP